MANFGNGSVFSGFSGFLSLFFLLEEGKRKDWGMKGGFRRLLRPFSGMFSKRFLHCPDFSGFSGLPFGQVSKGCSDAPQSPASPEDA